MTRLTGCYVEKYKCDHCGKIDFLSDSWMSYSSIAMAETCPGDIPTACNPACMEEIMRKIKSGQMILPVLRSDPGGFYVFIPRQGY